MYCAQLTPLGYSKLHMIVLQISLQLSACPNATDAPPGAICSNYGNAGQSPYFFGSLDQAYIAKRSMQSLSATRSGAEATAPEDCCTRACESSAAGLVEEYNNIRITAVIALPGPGANSTRPGGVRVCASYVALTRRWRCTRHDGPRRRDASAALPLNSPILPMTTCCARLGRNASNARVRCLNGSSQRLSPPFQLQTPSQILREASSKEREIQKQKMPVDVTPFLSPVGVW